MFSAFSRSTSHACSSPSAHVCMKVQVQAAKFDSLQRLLPIFPLASTAFFRSSLPTLPKSLAFPHRCTQLNSISHVCRLFDDIHRSHLRFSKTGRPFWQQVPQFRRHLPTRYSASSVCFRQVQVLRPHRPYADKFHNSVCVSRKFHDPCRMFPTSYSVSSAVWPTLSSISWNIFQQL